MEFISGMIWGAICAGAFILFVVFRKYDFHPKHEWSWTCPRPGCYFKLSSNYPTVTLLEMAERHDRYHEEQEE